MYIITPKDQQSQDLSYFPLLRISGAKQIIIKDKCFNLIH